MLYNYVYIHNKTIKLVSYTREEFEFLRDTGLATPELKEFDSLTDAKDYQFYLYEKYQKLGKTLMIGEMESHVGGKVKA